MSLTNGAREVMRDGSGKEVCDLKAFDGGLKDRKGVLRADMINRESKGIYISKEQGRTSVYSQAWV
jgi:hypothetical protein